MEIVTFSEKDRNQYKDFLLESEYKNFLQSWEWGELKSRFNWQAQRIGFFKDNELRGIAQVLKRKLPLGFDLLYIPRGPIADWSDLDLINNLLDCLKDFFSKNKVSSKTLFLRLEPPVEENEKLAKILKQKGFSQYFKTVQPPSTLLIDLTMPEEQLFRSFRRTARNLINRSQREGMTVDALTANQVSQNDLKGFYNLYRLTGKRFSFPLRPFKQFALMLKVADLGMVRLYIAKIRGLILAYGIVIIMNDKAFYIWGGTTRHDYYSKFFNYGYIWEMLKDLKKLGVNTFDFWGLGPEDDKNHPWYGFTLFKRAFGGKRFDYLGAFDLPFSKFYPLFKLIDKIATPRYRATTS